MATKIVFPKTFPMAIKNFTEIRLLDKMSYKRITNLCNYAKHLDPHYYCIYKYCNDDDVFAILAYEDGVNYLILLRYGKSNFHCIASYYCANNVLALNIDRENIEIPKKEQKIIRDFFDGFNLNPTDSELGFLITDVVKKESEFVYKQNYESLFNSLDNKDVKYCCLDFFETSLIRLFNNSIMNIYDYSAISDKDNIVIDMDTKEEIEKKYLQLGDEPSIQDLLDVVNGDITDLVINKNMLQALNRIFVNGILAIGQSQLNQVQEVKEGNKTFVFPKDLEVFYRTLYKMVDCLEQKRDMTYTVDTLFFFVRNAVKFHAKYGDNFFSYKKLMKFQEGVAAVHSVMDSILCSASLVTMGVTKYKFKYKGNKHYFAFCQLDVESKILRNENKRLNNYTILRYDGKRWEPMLLIIDHKPIFKNDKYGLTNEDLLIIHNAIIGDFIRSCPLGDLILVEIKPLTYEDLLNVKDNPLRFSLVTKESSMEFFKRDLNKISYFDAYFVCKAPFGKTRFGTFIVNTDNTANYIYDKDSGLNREDAKENAKHTASIMCRAIEALSMQINSVIDYMDAYTKELSE